MEVSFKHSGNAGDIIYALAAIKTFKDAHRDAVIKLYLNLNTPAFYYKNAVHPVKDDGGQEVMLNAKMASMLTPLLQRQHCIDLVDIYDRQKVTIDLDKVRREDCGMPYLPIQRWYAYLFPDLYCDIAKPWLSAGLAAPASGKIVINRTFRYTNPWIDFKFLRDYDPERFMFVGLEEEWSKFNSDFGLDIPHYPVYDFNELAGVIKASAFFIGNQSMAFGIAEGLKVPRILESCVFAPNVIPAGPNAYDFLYTEGLKYCFEKLYKQFAA